MVPVRYDILFNFRHYILAVGFENGEIEIEKWNLDQDAINNSDNCLKRWSAHSETINKLRYFVIIIGKRKEVIIYHK